MNWFDSSYRIGRPLRGRAFRFLLIGGITAVCYIGTMALMVDVMNTSATVGAVVAFIVGTIVSYLGNSLYTFDAALGGRAMSRFVVVVLFGLISNVGIAWLLEGFGFHHLLISLVILVIVPVQNFVLHETWTFRGNRD